MHQRLLHDSLFATARRHPDRIAVVDGDRRYSYAELEDAALRLARALQDLGLERGERVAIHGENGWESAVAIYATLVAGGTIVLIHPQTVREKIVRLLRDSEAALLISDDPPTAAALAGEAAVRVVVCSGGGRTPASCRDVAELLAATAPEPRPAGTIPLDLAALIYTSGSTGAPKGAMMTHQSMVFTLGSVSEYLRLDRDDRIFNVLPLAFSYGLYQLFMAVALGATVILERRSPYPAVLAERLRATAATVFPAVPTIFATLLELRRRGADPLPAVRTITNAAAALPEEFVPSLADLFPNARLFKMYGMTECKRVCYLEPELVASKPFSVGKAIPGTEVFLLDDAGRPVGPGEIGVLHVRGPHLMRGYWRQPERTAHMLKEGRHPHERVLCTHDLFKMDEDGFLYFVARSDDVLKLRGEKVSPVEIENVLHGIPGVRSAAVVGVDDPVDGHAIRAFVVREEGSELGAAEIRRACREHLEPIRIPREVVFLAELPTTSSGKVRKKNLRESRYGALDGPPAASD